MVYKVEPTEKEVKSSKDPHLKYYFNLGGRDMVRKFLGGGIEYSILLCAFRQNLSFAFYGPTNAFVAFVSESILEVIFSTWQPARVRLLPHYTITVGTSLSVNPEVCVIWHVVQCGCGSDGNHFHFGLPCRGLSNSFDVYLCLLGRT